MINLNKISNDQLLNWFKNKTINPLSKRKIKINGPIFNKISKLYEKRIKKKKKSLNDYESYRRNKIDPILLQELPLNGMKENDLFKFEYEWDPYTGIRSKKKDSSTRYSLECCILEKARSIISDVSFCFHQ